VGICGSALAVLWTSWENYRSVERAPHVQIGEVERLKAGDRIYLEGVIRSSDPEFFEKMQDGCIVDLETPEGTAEATNAEVRYEVQIDDGSFELIWRGECPDGNLVLAEPPENPTRAWLGYAEGTPVLIEGERTDEDEVSLFPVHLHVPKDSQDAADWWEGYKREPRTHSVLALAALLASVLVFFGLLRAPGTRKQWNTLAQKAGWEHQKGRLSPGHIRGLIDDCELDIHRMEFLGAEGVTPSHVEIHLTLPAHLPAPALEPLLQAAEPESRLGRAIRDSGLRAQLEKLAKKSHSLQLSKNQLVMTLKGLSPRQIEHGVQLLAQTQSLLRETALADIRSLAESRGWRLELGAEWRAWDGEGHPVLSIRSEPPAHAWLSMPLPPDAPEGLRVQAKEGAEPGVRLTDPILAEFVVIDASQPTRVSTLITRPGLTEAILDLVKGHGGEVREGCIRIEDPVDRHRPTEAWESMEALAVLLSQD
jgi:hypothetical protein